MSKWTTAKRVLGTVLSLPTRLLAGPIERELSVFFPPWACYREGHPHASHRWRTVAGLTFGLSRLRQNSLRLRAVRTANGDVLLGISQYSEGKHYSKPLCTVTEGSRVQVRFQEHRKGQLCLSVYRGRKLLGCYWHQLPEQVLPLWVELLPD